MTRMPLARLMAEYRPGSQDPPWSWEDERAVLMGDGPHSSIMRDLLDILGAGKEVAPVVLGDDGRVWDGHHRIIAAWVEGCEDIPVEWAKADAHEPFYVKGSVQVLYEETLWFDFTTGTWRKSEPKEGQ